MVDYINGIKNKKQKKQKKKQQQQQLASNMSEFKRSTVYGYQQYQTIVNLSDLIIQPNPGAGLIGVQHQTTNNVYVRSNENRAGLPTTE